MKRPETLQRLESKYINLSFINTLKLISKTKTYKKVFQIGPSRLQCHIFIIKLVLNNNSLDFKEQKRWHNPLDLI